MEVFALEFFKMYSIKKFSRLISGNESEDSKVACCPIQRKTFLRYGPMFTQK